jgi:RNA polymerase sigma-70 factor, ECF subfamily
MTELIAERAAGPPPDLVDALEGHRSELTAYAYRMLGSAFEAEDAVQDAMLRAWRSLDRLQGREAMRAWLYRIVTNVSLDMLKSRKRRTRPMDVRPPQSASTPLPAPLPETTWIEPIPDDRVLPGGVDPAEVAETRESVRLAFIAALQHLPPKQRAVLILREVLHWHADEVAELLDTSVASVNSALQRARAAVASRTDGEARPEPMDDAQRDLLARYVDAFERYDMSSLTALLRDDATWNMPPFDLWLRGHDDIVRWCLGQGIACDDSRLVPASANGAPAFAQYKPDPNGGRTAWSLQVLDVSDGRIAGITFFLDVERIFPMFGLPLRLEDEAPKAG